MEIKYKPTYYARHKKPSIPGQMKFKPVGSHGGKRAGAGRPKKEPTKVIRVPLSKLDAIKVLLRTPRLLTNEPAAISTHV